MSDLDNLTELILTALWAGPGAQNIAETLLAAGWRPPVHVITTVKELSKLPYRSVVLVPDGSHAGVWRTSSVPGWWWCVDAPDASAAAHELLTCGAVVVLYIPTEVAS